MQIETLQQRPGDREEGLSMSDRIAVMDSGQIAQIGSLLSLYSEPVSPFVAEFIVEPGMVDERLMRLTTAQGCGPITKLTHS
ncbi:hypothetical protein NKH84_31055 [Mesorhizobium sp. M0902]|uniref:hypothetical protein n=1 Tax=Mesorhizobium sp. M0902 TaxID=2957021 RepID=UPI0033353051